MATIPLLRRLFVFFVVAITIQIWPVSAVVNTTSTRPINTTPTPRRRILLNGEVERDGAGCLVLASRGLPKGGATRSDQVSTSTTLSLGIPNPTQPNPNNAVESDSPAGAA